MWIRELWLPIDVTFGIIPKLITAPHPENMSKSWGTTLSGPTGRLAFFPMEWSAHVASKLWQMQQGSILEDRDIVLVSATAFKGRHKIQSRWENREYVLKWQSYANLPVYMVHPIDGEGKKHTLHKNYLLPISNNLEQEGENSVGVDPVTNQLQYHMRMIHWQPTTLLKVNWKAFLIHYQNIMNHVTQGWPGQTAGTPQRKVSKLTMMHLFHQGKAQE